MLLKPLVAVLALGFLVVACSSEAVISKEELERAVFDSLVEIERGPERVECPGEITAELAATTTCVMSSDGKRYGVEVTVMSVRDGQASYEIDVDTRPMS